nr:Ldh family oxidoreductase [Spirochaetaceae bacterium]
MGYADAYKNCSWIKFDMLESFMTDSLISAGLSEKDAKIVADVLMESDRRGIDSHGIGRLKPIYIDRIDWGILNPQTKIDLIKETETTAVLDGNNGMGHVVSHRAMEMAIEKAKKLGMAMVAVRNSTHYGIAGYYASMAAKAGLIGITGTNARPSIAPTLGVENMLGTNPLTIGLPTDEE